MDGSPLGLGLVVEDKPTEFSCIYPEVPYTALCTISCICSWDCA